MNDFNHGNFTWLYLCDFHWAGTGMYFESTDTPRKQTAKSSSSWNVYNYTRCLKKKNFYWHSTDFPTEHDNTVWRKPDTPVSQQYFWGYTTEGYVDIVNKLSAYFHLQYHWWPNDGTLAPFKLAWLWYEPGSVLMSVLMEHSHSRTQARRAGITMPC